MQRLTYVEVCDRLREPGHQGPDDLVLHKVRGLGAVRRGDLEFVELEHLGVMHGQGFRIYLWRDAWCVTGDLREIEDLGTFLHVGEDVMVLEAFLEARCAA